MLVNVLTPPSGNPVSAPGRASYLGGRFPSSFIHQVIITSLNKLYDELVENSCSRSEDGLRCPLELRLTVNRT